jgi:SAM-dependent methyltransferase
MLSLERQNALRRQYRQLKPGWRPATEVYAGLAQAHLQPQARLLDLGCGRGGLVEQLGHPLSLVVGVDPDWHSLRQHRLPLPRAVALSHQLPLATGRFDVVLASWVLEHLAQPSLVFQEIHRVLRPGGVFVFITPNGRHPLAWLNRLFGHMGRRQGRIVKWLYGRSGADTFPTYYRANTVTALHRLSRQGGLDIIQVYLISDPTYLAFTPGLFRLMSWFEAHLPESRRIHIVGLCQRRAVSQ